MFREGADEKRRDDRWETLKRRVQLLSRLDGKAILLAEGVHMVHPTAVKEPDRVIATLRAKGVLDCATFERAFVNERPPVVITREVLAVAQRDLRALATQPALSLARDRKRALARYGDIDEAWLKKKRERVDLLAGAVAHAVPHSKESWFDAVVDIVRLLRDETSALELARARRRLTSLGAERRRLARERIDALASALESGEPPADADLVPLVERLDRARELPGRARRTRVLDVLRKALAWPAAPAEAVHALAAPLRDKSFVTALREAGHAMVHALPAARDPALRDKTLEMLAFYGLLFRIGQDGVPLLSPEDIERAIAKKEDARALAVPKGTLAQALTILELPFKKFARKLVAEWVADGLELELVVRACKEGHADALARASTARAARAYATWATKLVPHYRALGITFELSPELFTHLPRNEDVAVLAVCLMEQAREGAKTDPKAPPADPIAILDATLGMFQKLPAKAASILARLKGTNHGAGRRAFPELAAWLDDDALLDRFVHLAHVAGVPVSLGKQLREDFEHAAKAAQERAHLAALPARSSRQDARLATLSAGDRTLAAAPRGRTKRRLRERIDELLPRAYRRELDDAFREILRDAWGIAVPSLTDAWRDAVRFWLVVDDNRDLLGRLLREAAAQPGRDVKLAFVKNREWIMKVRSALRIDAWLAPRREEIDVDGTTYVVTLEEDPLEVLRMGIPFGTCLALETGCNAASTVLNAIDANKRVIYVRSRDRKVIARKLIVLSEEHRLLGYNLYVSTRGPGERAIRNAIDAMCRAISNDVGAPLAVAGEPEKIHEGFWYDDGTVPWGEDADVASYCSALGLAAPPKWFDAIATEARARCAIDDGDVDSAIAVLTRWDGGPANIGLGRWIVERLGEKEAIRRSKEHTAIVPALLRAAATPNEDGMLRAIAMATRVDEYCASQAISTFLAAFPRSVRIANALAELAVRGWRMFPRSNEHGLVHASMSEMPSFVEGVEASFDALDRADRVWHAFAKQNSGCDGCRRRAWDRTIAEMRAQYIRHPEPDAVLSCMMSRHRGLLSQRVAIAIAARNVLPGATRALARLATLRPHIGRSAMMLTAQLRQEGITSISEELAKKLPKPTESPFEELGELLFEVDGIERVLGSWPMLGDKPADTWTPGPWELAWLRTRPEWPIREALYAIAARTPDRATRAMELLASLADLERLEKLRLLAEERHARPAWLPEGAKLRGEEPKITDPKTWKTTFDCQAAAQSASMQIASIGKRPLPPEGVGRKDVVDRRLVAVAVAKLEDKDAPRLEREVALDVIAAWSEPLLRWDELLGTLVAQGDERGLSRILHDKITKSTMLRPELVARIWTVPGARGALATALATHAGDDWSARATACERAATRLELDVDGLFEAWALALVETSAASTAAETETADQLHVVIRLAVTQAAPVRAVGLYEELLDDLSASYFIRAVKRLPRDRSAALREAAGKLRFNGDRGTARKAWILATRSLKKSRSSSIERE